MRLAKQYKVERAPFFLVEQNGRIEVFDVFFKFKKFMRDRNLNNSADLNT